MNGLDALLRVISCICVASISCVLVASFALHAVQIEHTHFGERHEHSEGHGHETQKMSVYMHASEKKIFELLLILVLIPFTLQRTEIFERLLVRLIRIAHIVTRLYQSVTHTFSYISLHLRKGHIHPKTF